ncbi:MULTISPECIES: outer membrane lipoprotein chaperone LolA [unclassified Halomonas]|uniref:outer membrane lipoprotein chaperone LolA n=1 Tax=unclassified Halomonas TaxID=2609666 RepID=UPI0006DBA121|nr:MULTISPECIES: outer membrane lipoprotein chaperone LolA [unclassified Halomonas]KPQ27720.1 MAG: outer membrane lipoprotein carrier protein LolA [Halomonas sp. HL-93]SBR50086.1 outer membrane lipoprotein carrier protein [Halomonas sp. HL-93]SNY96672.1 outer membrane lipoprotein carrier protein [Halomonas sp. hl-4]
MSDTQTRRPSSLLLAASALGLTFTAPLAIANEAAERLTERLDPLESYQASFEQEILDGSGDRLQEARGEMWLSRPGMLRWEVEAPYAQTVVSDGDEVYLYDPDLEQVTVQALDERVTHTPALLLSGRVSELTENYDVEYEDDGGDDIFTLVPTSADTLFEQLRMTFDGDMLTELWMTDSTGQRTSIIFSNAERNEDIDDERFEFEVPDGADVIREDER